MSYPNYEADAKLLGSLVVDDTPDDHAQGEQRLLAALQTNPGAFPPRSAGRTRVSQLFSGRIRVATTLVAAAALAAVVVLTLAASPDPPPSDTLNYEVAQRENSSGGRVVSAAHQANAIRFSDGSRFKLNPNGSVRISELGPQGARLVLEHGSLESKVVKREQASWSVFAGPYEVRVIGTKFSTNWSPAAQRISVVLHEGTVQILGTGIDTAVELKAGQRFDAGGQASRWSVTAQKGALPTGDSPPTPSPEPSLETTPNNKKSTKTSQTGAPFETAPQAAAPTKSWSALVAAGSFAEVKRLARLRGSDHCVNSCSPSDLKALADAARYTGDGHLARQALQKLRQISSGEAPRAAYLLGSLSEARGQAANALKWYSTYTREAPSGAFLAEAEAGRLRSMLALGQTRAAQLAAENYLRKHPTGVGAGVARKILQAP